MNVNQEPAAGQSAEGGGKQQFASLLEFFQHAKETQGDIAAELGISQSALSLIVNGKRMPRPDLALRLSERTGVPVEALLKARLNGEVA